jgi:hypothetical protein
LGGEQEQITKPDQEIDHGRVNYLMDDGSLEEIGALVTQNN